MNRRTIICLLVAGALAACGQPPSRVAGRPAEITTTTAETTTSTTTTAAPAPQPKPQPPPPPPPPPRRTTTTKPPPPPPKPPDRWVLPANMRKSIEERTSQPFPGVWEQLKTELARVCPGKVLCVGYSLRVDPSVVSEQNCFIAKGGISVPDPLREGGRITFRVNNDLCAEG